MFCHFFSRGTISVHDLTIGKGCRLLLSQTGTSRLLNDSLDTSIDLSEGSLAGHYRFDALTIAADGEVTSVDDGDDMQENFTLSVQRLKVEGGGHLHTTRMEINADILIVDDLGKVVADVHEIPCEDEDGAGKDPSSSYGGSGMSSLPGVIALLYTVAIYGQKTNLTNVTILQQ